MFPRIPMCTHSMRDNRKDILVHRTRHYLLFSTTSAPRQDACRQLFIFTSDSRLKKSVVLTLNIFDFFEYFLSRKTEPRAKTGDKPRGPSEAYEAMFRCRINFSTLGRASSKLRHQLSGRRILSLRRCASWTQSSPSRSPSLFTAYSEARSCSETQNNNFTHLKMSALICTQEKAMKDR